jgi:hypothetical protein
MAVKLPESTPALFYVGVIVALGERAHAERDRLRRATAGSLPRAHQASKFAHTWP